MLLNTLPCRSQLHYIKEFRAWGDITRLGPNTEHDTVFKPQEEVELTNNILTGSNMFYGLTSKATRHLVYEMVVVDNLHFPVSWKASKKDGRDWLIGFMVHNSKLSLRKPEATSMARGTSFNRHNVATFIKNLEEVYRSIKVIPFNVYYLY
ncbi:tigger transposable element-derived protein [Plakobranchus ocellatus]|uniref:Tigger transposable element-derived protein n=1 Tax=Plakobranchus ocellatus TaxID=259542 RepID=A0AAV4AVL3_9GAST|nr:tigger transposable element-derived protein [Plakobranchus ocellatus]